MNGWLPIVVAAGASLATAGIGAYATDIGEWYFNLKKPRWQPPDWLFGPAWTTIFILIAISGYLAWRDAPGQGDRTLVIVAFAVNLVLNAAWSVLFFTMKRPDLALIEVVVFWLSIVALITVAAQYSTLAAWLLVPYLVWVTFASVLNYTIVRLNGPFKPA